MPSTIARIANCRSVSLATSVLIVLHLLGIDHVYGFIDESWSRFHCRLHTRFPRLI